MTRARVVVLGSNFGGLTAALAVRQELHGDVDVTVVSASDRFLFTPSLIWLPFGKRAAADITFPVEPTLTEHGIDFVHSAAFRIDPDEKVVDSGARRVAYDYLVVATGYRNDFDAVPGLGPDGAAHTITTLDDAERTGAAWRAFLDEPGDIVIGATQGAGCFGAAYEFLFNTAHQLRKAGLRRRARLTYVTPEPFLGYEAPVRSGMVMYAGVDYAEILRRAQQEADIIVWDGGNNDLSFYVPDLLVTVVDPLRPGHELRYHPGETNLRMADVVVVNKVDSAELDAVARVVADVEAANPRATVVRAASPVDLEPGPSLAGRRVLVVEDGPTITHGGMPFGAGVVAARQAGATKLVDPRPYAVGSIAATYARCPDIGPVLPAMGYGDAQLAELGETIRAVPCDAVVVGTPMDLGRLTDLGHPSRRATYELREVGSPTLAAVLAPYLAKWKRERASGGT